MISGVAFAMSMSVSPKHNGNEVQSPEFNQILDVVSQLQNTNGDMGIGIAPIEGVKLNVNGIIQTAPMSKVDIGACTTLKNGSLTYDQTDHHLYGCTNGEWLQLDNCMLDCSCEGNTCVGETCADGCGGTCDGTLTDTTWKPKTDTVCDGVSFTQTGSECDGTRTAIGTKTNGSCAADCTATTISDCVLSTTSSEGTDGTCTSGYTGSCLYTCNDGTWGSPSTNSCTPPPSSCTGTTIGNCVVSTTGSGSTSGTCTSGYTGSCSYTCDDGTWGSPSADSCIVDCPVVDGGWSAWSAWECDLGVAEVTPSLWSQIAANIFGKNLFGAIAPSGETSPDGSSSTSRTRTCTNPAPSCGGASCSGSSTETIYCASGEVCSGGACTTSCNDTCSSLGYECGTQTVCGVSTNCGTCATGETCSASGICESIDPCLPDHNTTGCDGYGTNVYWFDNCGAQNDLKEDCGGAGCTGGVCNGDPCPGQSMTDNCILQPTPSGSTSGDCYTGYTGTCSYRCNAGSWSMETSNCSLPASCTAQSMSDNCILSETPSGGTSGTCYTGYTGDCSYSCNDGTWSKVSGNCEAPTAPEVITCDPGYELSGGVCVKKCWSIIQTTGVGTVREGDTRGTGECSSTIPVDNPECGSFLGCPLQCNHGYMQISNTGSGDSCWQDQWIGKTWHTREQWICQQRMSRTKCYGESCTASEYSTSLNGTMDANGNCIKNPGGAGCTGGVCNGDPCPGQSMTDNCILQPTPSGSTSGDCYTGYTGTCSYRCNAGSWSMETSNCSLPASCTAQSMSDNCILSETPSGGTSGTCYTGYTGDCSYSCNDGTWSKVSGNCEAPTAPEVITCDPGYELSGGVCVKKCWSIIQTTGVGTVREGDTRGTGECSSTIPVDNPECGSFLGCPLQCNHGYMQISNTGSGDSCWQDQWIGKTWHTREQWICQQRMSRTKCYGESCTASEYSTSLNGTMDANGNCIKNPTVPTGGGGGDGCFVAGTMIHMANGELQAIEEVELGDLLMGSEGINKVHNKYVIPFEGWLYSINGSNTFVTETHPFMTEEGWKSFAPELTKKETPGLDVSLLEKGDRLITNKGIVTLESFGREWGKTTVYNFNVTNTHDFWADGYLVHNVRTELLLAKIILESKSEQQ